MITLAIETSCDETAVCLLETEGSPEGIGNVRYRILGNLIHSQIELHAKYGGVFPVMAKREHSRNLVPLLETLIRESGISVQELAKEDAALTHRTLQQVEAILKEKEPELLVKLMASSLISQRPLIDQIAVTEGPGLEPALWVGVNGAKALSALWNIPLVAVNHMEGHIVGSLLPVASISSTTGPFQTMRPLTLPALALLISGGHTELVLIKRIGEYEIIGRTCDDAVGEAFDKVARMLGLSYPGGPHISALAAEARLDDTYDATQVPIRLPRPMIHSGDLNFSFSGLKTAVLYLIQQITGVAGAGGRVLPHSADIVPLSDRYKKEIAREFEDAITDVLVAKTEQAIDTYLNGIGTLLVGGGVIANKYICQALERLAAKHHIPLYLPPAGVSGDNALMIAFAATLSTGSVQPPVPIIPIKARGNLSL